MSFKKYLLDKSMQIFITISGFIITILLLNAFKVERDLILVISIIFIIVKTLVYGDPTPGWPSMACITVFVSGIQLFTIGIIGQYLSKTYLEVKKRPIYIVKETEKDGRIK